MISVVRAGRAGDAVIVHDDWSPGAGTSEHHDPSKLMSGFGPPLATLTPVRGA